MLISLNWNAAWVCRGRTSTSKSNITPYHVCMRLFLRVSVRALRRRQEIRCFEMLSSLRRDSRSTTVKGTRSFEVFVIFISLVLIGLRFGEI